MFDVVPAMSASGSPPVVTPTASHVATAGAGRSEPSGNAAIASPAIATTTSPTTGA